jgi:hypothetical protein
MPKSSYQNSNLDNIIGITTYLQLGSDHNCH